MRESNENNFAATRADLFDIGSNVPKTFFDRFLHFRHEDIEWDERWWWRCEKWNPDLLNSSRQFAIRILALRNHSGASLAIDRAEVGRKARRNMRSGSIWDRQTFQKSLKGEIILL